MSKLIFTLSDLNFLGSERSHFREKTIVGKELAQPLPKNKKPALLRSVRAFCWSHNSLERLHATLVLVSLGGGENVRFLRFEE